MAAPCRWAARSCASDFNAGTPIPPDVQARIFLPMTRGTDSNAGRSVGLGLFIVQEIARAHGGTVQVTSNAEEGTTFLATMQRA